jgi:flagellar basal body-associated protein FliL
MADQETKEKTEQGAKEQEPKKGGLGKLLPWLVPGLTLVVCAGAGFAISRFFGTRGSAQNVAAAEPVEIPAADQMPPLNATDTEATWYYDLEAVVANLNEPNVTRYVRVTLTLEVGNGMAEKDGIPFLDQKGPLLKNWLTLFMSNQTVEDIRGERNLRQVQAQIADMFNQGLFPNSKPCIKRVLFKELSIQ